MTGANPAERYPFWDYQDLLIFVSLAIPSLLLGGLLSKSVFVLIGWQPPGKAAQLLPAQFLGYGFWFLSLYGLLKLRYRKPFWRSLGWISPGVGVIFRCFVAGPLLAIAIGLGGYLLRTPDIEMPIKDLLTDPFSIALIGIFATTLGPVFEELAFRGFLLPLLVRSVGAFVGVILTALPFAILHGPQYAWSWRHLLLLTLASAVFGLVRLYMGSTVAAAALHASYNFTFFVVYLLQDKDY
jgi:membrane protease YdiL (CAAX protease family)